MNKEIRIKHILRKSMGQDQNLINLNQIKLIREMVNLDLNKEKLKQEEEIENDSNNLLEQYINNYMVIKILY